MEKATLAAPDISCDHCIQSIQKAVEALPGARFVSGDPAVKQVIVEYDSAQTLTAIVAALEDEGYPVQK